jgi:hypothetical protein
MAHDTTIIGATAANGKRRIGGEDRHRVSTITRPTTVAEIHRGDQTPDEVLVLDEQQRTGIEPPHHQPPSRIAAVPEPGMPSASIGSSAAVPRRARGLRREHPSIRPCRTSRIFGEALGQVVAHERGGDRAARRDPEPAADRGERSSVTQ